jgi:hypothetical protein
VNLKLFLTLFFVCFFNDSRPPEFEPIVKRSLASVLDKNDCIEILNTFILYRSISIERPLQNVSRKFINQLGSEYFATTTSYNVINKNNFNDLFSHQYDSDHLESTGIKAIIYRHLDNDFTVSFWSTGKKEVSNNLHHRDALINAISVEAKKYDSTEYINEELWFKLNEEKDSLENLGRNHQAYTKNLLERSQGFQLTAKEIVLGGVKKKVITYLDIDSSITSAQISQNVFPSEEMLASQLAQILNRIDPAVLQLKAIRIQGVEDKRKLDFGLILEILKEKMNNTKISLPPITPLRGRDMRGANTGPHFYREGQGLNYFFAVNETLNVTLSSIALSAKSEKNFNDLYLIS